jgi:hypothetical protein
MFYDYVFVPIKLNPSPRKKELPWYSWNNIESGVKHHNPYANPLFLHMYWIFATQKTKEMSNADPVKNIEWIKVLAKGKQFLLLIIHPTCCVTHIYSQVQSFEFALTCKYKFIFVLCLVHPMLQVSLVCSFLISPSVSLTFIYVKYFCFAISLCKPIISLTFFVMLWFVCVFFFLVFDYALEKNVREIKNGHSRETGSIGYIRHRTETKKAQTK